MSMLPQKLSTFAEFLTQKNEVEAFFEMQVIHRPTKSMLIQLIPHEYKLVEIQLLKPSPKTSRIPIKQGGINFSWGFEGTEFHITIVVDDVCKALFKFQSAKMQMTLRKLKEEGWL